MGPSRRTKAPNGMSLVTRPISTWPMTKRSTALSHSSGWARLSESEILRASRSTRRTYALTSSPTLKRSFAFLPRSQVSSVRWARPSAPPRSTKTPKSVMEEIRPSRISPSWSSWMIRSFCSRRHSVMAARSERMARFLRRFSSMTLRRTSLPTRVARALAASGLSRRMLSIWERGMKALTPSTLASTPPRLWPTISAEKISPDSRRPARISQPSSPRARSRETMPWPSELIGWRTMTRTVSPAFRRLWPSTPMESISLWGMTASVLVPTSTMTPSGEAPMTTPSMISPRRRLLGWAASVSRRAAMSISALGSGCAAGAGAGVGGAASGAGGGDSGAGSGVAGGSATPAGAGGAPVVASGACSSVDTGGLRLTALPV